MTFTSPSSSPNSLRLPNPNMRLCAAYIPSSTVIYNDTLLHLSRDKRPVRTTNHPLVPVELAQTTLFTRFSHSTSRASSATPSGKTSQAAPSGPPHYRVIYDHPKPNLNNPLSTDFQRSKTRQAGRQHPRQPPHPQSSTSITSSVPGGGKAYPFGRIHARCVMVNDRLEEVAIPPCVPPILVYVGL